MKDIPISIPKGIDTINMKNINIVKNWLRVKPLFCKNYPTVIDKGTWWSKIHAVIIKDSVTWLYTPIDKPSMIVWRIIAKQNV